MRGQYWAPIDITTKLDDWLSLRGDHFVIVVTANEQSNDPIIVLDLTPDEACMRSPTQNKEGEHAA
jgi:hypothetical protein